MWPGLRTASDTSEPRAGPRVRKQFTSMPPPKRLRGLCAGRSPESGTGSMVVSTMTGGRGEQQPVGTTERSRVVDRNPFRARFLGSGAFVVFAFVVALNPGSGTAAAATYGDAAVADVLANASASEGRSMAKEKLADARVKLRTAEQKLRKATRSGDRQRTHKARKRLKKAQRRVTEAKMVKKTACDAPPTASDDDARTDEESSRQIDVLSNDSNPNGRRLKPSLRQLRHNWFCGDRRLTGQVRPRWRLRGACRS